MIKKVFAAVVLSILFTVAMVQAMEKEDTPEVKEGPGINVNEKALDFQLKDLSGKDVKLSDFKGKKVMLNFWATWCPPCKAEMPAMQELYEKHKDEMVILAVNLDPKNDVAGFVTEKGLTFPILLEDQSAVNEQYQVISIPTSYFIDAEGIIRNKHIGALNLTAMEKYLEGL